MAAQIKDWVLQLLDPPRREKGLSLTVKKSGAVQFDVGAYQQTDQGKKQLALATRIGRSLKRGHVSK